MVLLHKGLGKDISTNSDPIFLNFCFFDSKPLGCLRDYGFFVKFALSAIPYKAEEGVDFKIFFWETRQL